MMDEDFVPITPINFFQLAVDCHQLPASGSFPQLNKNNERSYLLPNTSELCGEESFATVALGWNDEGIEAYIHVNAPFHRVSYPNVMAGDGVELFFDTRDVKSSGFNTRFCHHFFFLLEAVEGVVAGEITRFRTEDVHPLCDAKELKVKGKRESSGYLLHIGIPKSCLYGYDPQQFKRLGFSYRINRAYGFPQHFSVTTDDFAVDQQPSLWSSLKLL